MTEIRKRVYQVGVEAVAGTSVAATREWFGEGRIQPAGPEPSMRVQERASYDAHHNAEEPIEDFEWSFEGGLDLDDIVEMLKVAARGAVTSTQPDAPGNPNVRNWTFLTADTAPDTVTLRWDAAGDVFLAAYAMADFIEIAGGVSGGDVTVRLGGPCKDMVAASALTSIADVVNRITQGWETKLFLDAFGAAPLTTAVDGALLSWRVRLANGLTRFRGSQNDRLFTRLTRNLRVVESELVVDMATQANTEITNRRAVTKRIIGLRIGNNDLISTTYNKKLDLAIPGAWTSSPIAEDGGVSTVQLSHRAVYDATNAYAFRALVQNTRAT